MRPACALCLALAKQALLRVSDRLRAPRYPRKSKSNADRKYGKGSSELNPTRDNVVGHQHWMFDNCNTEREGATATLSRLFRQAAIYFGINESLTFARASCRSACCQCSALHGFFGRDQWQDGPQAGRDAESAARSHGSSSAAISATMQPIGSTARSTVSTSVYCQGGEAGAA